MKRWALITGDIVANVVEQADAPAIPGVWVECTADGAGPGWTYSAGDFSPPEPAETP